MRSKSTMRFWRFAVAALGLVFVMIGTFAFQHPGELRGKVLIFAALFLLFGVVLITLAICANDKTIDRLTDYL